MKIKITADSTCDLSPELLRENNISIIPLHINKNGESFSDGLDIVPADIFAHVAAGGELCSTSAVSLGEYEEAFKRNLEGYDALVHISIGSGFSVTHHNACLVAENMPNVRVIDSRNLSTGQGQIVLEACRLAKNATDLDEMKEALDEYAARVDMSFLLDRLDYMVKGGRCSLVSALGANILKLKPCIEVVDNKMIVGKKYRGNYAKCMERYVLDRLENNEDIEPERIFIVNTPVSQEVLETVRQTVRGCMEFETTYETTAGCTISCHCGEGTLGICYVHKKA